MPRFHFNLRADGAIHRDVDGTELPDIAAAYAHARAVAEELMLNAHYGTFGWSLSVEDGTGDKTFDVFFAEVAPRLAAFSPDMQRLANETCRTIAAGIEACDAMRAARMESRLRLARARRRPTLVYARGG